MVQIACFAVDGQWFNTAAPQIGMRMLFPIKKIEKEDNLSVITKDKKPNQIFLILLFAIMMLAYYSGVFKQNKALNFVVLQGMHGVLSRSLLPQPTMLTGFIL